MHGLLRLDLLKFQLCEVSGDILSERESEKTSALCILWRQTATAFFSSSDSPGTFLSCFSLVVP